MDFLTSQHLEPMGQSASSICHSITALVKPKPGQNDGQLVMKMDASWLCSPMAEQYASHLAAVQCHLLLLSGELDPFTRQVMSRCPCSLLSFGYCNSTAE